MLQHFNHEQWGIPHLEPSVPPLFCHCSLSWLAEQRDCQNVRTDQSWQITNRMSWLAECPGQQTVQAGLLISLKHLDC